jgi:predicted ATP-grasp superfamily ATP-dependent carboligase
MAGGLEIFEKPKAKEIYMLAGWRQWADAGSVSSGLPGYLANLIDAQPIGEIHSEGYYMFQIPGTHHLLRPIVKFDQGYPKSLDVPHNDFFYAGNEALGTVIFLGDEPHLNIESYVAALLEAAHNLEVKRIIGFGGVYGEVPYDKERTITGTYSMPRLKALMKSLAVTLSDYQGGASIGSYLCRRAAEKKIEYVSFYAFVPLYDFSNLAQVSSTIRIENDYMAWLGVTQRVNHMLKLNLDVTDLEEKSLKLVATLNSEVEELIKNAPQLDVQGYFERLKDEFTETPFVPPDDFWEEKLRGLFDDFD